MRAIDLRHLGREKVICCWQAGDVLVDPGPQSCEDTLVEALGGERPAAVLLTHIHFDHAGAAGALVRRWPGLPIYVHARGARHMADPERLVSSARRLYGDDFDRLWGEVVPVPEENLRVLHGGERDVEGAFRVEYTPGHASHHVSFLHEASGWAFVGDVGGAKIPPSDRVVAPMPPPDVDVDAWEASLDLIAGWSPQRLGIAHFGEVEDPAAQLEGCHAALHEEIELASRQDLDTFVAAFRDDLAERAPDEVAAYEQAVPIDHIWLGIDRWRSQRDR
jgi:glyoxylase-like metal-dependent hydrolase (beta-lactamase superfamily II)